jgi:hypothetical protein
MSDDGLYEWDEAKAEANILKHRIAFEAAHEFEWETALTRLDEGHSGAERRFQTLGRIGAHLYLMVWTPRGTKIRIISLRKAGKKEIAYYAEEYGQKIRDD